MLSLIATVLPASLPPGAPLIEQRQYHPLSGFSSGLGSHPDVRGYFTSGRGSGSSAMRW